VPYVDSRRKDEAPFFGVPAGQGNGLLNYKSISPTPLYGPNTSQARWSRHASTTNTCVPLNVTCTPPPPPTHTLNLGIVALVGFVTEPKPQIVFEVALPAASKGPSSKSPLTQATPAGNTYARSTHPNSHVKTTATGSRDGLGTDMMRAEGRNGMSF